MEKLGKHGARLKDLRRRVKRRPEGQVIVDGRRLVADVVRWNVPVLELYLAEGVDPDPEIAAENRVSVAIAKFVLIPP